MTDCNFGRSVRTLLCLIAFALLVFLAAGEASAAIVSVTGDAQHETDPTGFVMSQGGTDSPAESNTVVYAWDERQDFTLLSDLTVSFKVPPAPVSYTGDLTGAPTGTSTLPWDDIPADTVIDSHMLFFDPVGNSSTGTYSDVSGSVTFDTRIIGVIIDPALMNTGGMSSDFLAPPGVTPLDGPLRGLENVEDVVTVSADRYTLSFAFHARDGVEEVRVITAVPEPASWLLAILSATALRHVVRRRSSV